LRGFFYFFSKQKAFNNNPKNVHISGRFAEKSLYKYKNDIPRYKYKSTKNNKRPSLGEHGLMRDGTEDSGRKKWMEI